MEEKPRYVWYKGTRYHLNKGYYKTTYGLHRRIWEDYYGEIPKDHHIHHKNGDSTDNSIENLECLHKSKHHSIHFSSQRQVGKMQSEESRLKAKEWYRSEQGRAHQGVISKKGWESRSSIDKVCVICSKKFKTKNLNGTKYCSQACRSRCQTLRESIPQNCIICSAIFITRNLVRMSKTCSQKCKGLLISKTKSETCNDIIPPVI